MNTSNVDLELENKLAASTICGVRAVLIDSLNSFRAGRLSRIDLLAITKTAEQIVHTYRMELIYGATKEGLLELSQERQRRALL